MKSIRKSIAAFSLMALIQSAVGQESPLSLTELATTAKVNVPGGLLQLKNTIVGDATSVVGQITLTFYNSSACSGGGLATNTTLGGTPLAFTENTTITIQPSSVYATAVAARVNDPSTVASVIVNMGNTNNNEIFLGASGFPCFTVSCSNQTQQCITSDGVALITHSEAPPSDN